MKWIVALEMKAIWLFFVASFVLAWSSFVENSDIEKDWETSDITEGEDVSNGKLRMQSLICLKTMET